MHWKDGFGRLTLAGSLALFLASAPAVVGAQAQGRWERQAEDTFRLGPGMGQRLMTQEEWQEHWQKMQGMSPEERERYRQEWHQRMVERARERGISLPEMPGPPRGGQGTGVGPGGGMGGPGSRY